nr:hypothetical protein [Geitlerinema sp. PCC 9228]
MPPPVDVGGDGFANVGANGCQALGKFGGCDRIDGDFLTVEFL